MVIAADWKKIRNEYVTTNISQRDLAKKYKLAPTTIANKCKSENWVEQRRKNMSKIRAKSEQKIIEKLAEKQANKLLDEAEIISKASEELGKLLVLLQSVDIDINSPERKQVKHDKSGSKIVRELSGVDKTTKLVRSIGEVIKYSDIALESKKRYERQAEIPALEKAREILGGVDSVIN